MSLATEPEVGEEVVYICVQQGPELPLATGHQPSL